ncbi:MAG: Fic family protein [Ruminiclostridium sp.]|nr:Fic family protein [Ruminiclostridium sp.]
MPYLPLYKLYHSDKSAYEEQYNYRFNNDDTIHIDILIKGSEAFIYPSSDIYKAIIEIERIDKQVNKLTSELPDIAVKQYTVKSLIGEIVKTNDIEGVRSTRKEIGTIIDSIPYNKKSKRFVGLVNKYKALTSGEGILLKTCLDIRKIYDDIFIEEIDENDKPDGELFRAKSVIVEGDNGAVIHNGLEPESAINLAMTKSLMFLNDDRYDMLIRISAFHFLFGYIHPFYDGNGRTSRFISCYMLSKCLNPLIGYRLSHTIKENINKYYKGFEICEKFNSKGDLSPFVETFLNIILEAEKQLLETLTEKQQLYKDYYQCISSFPDKDLYDLLLQASLFSDKGIGYQDMIEHLHISLSTLKTKLGEIKPELLKKVKNKYVYYSLNLSEFDKE